MNFKRMLFYVIGAIFSIVFTYNFIISPMVTQNQKGMGMSMGMGMGMGMHRGMYYGFNYNYFLGYKYILYAIILVAIGVMLFALYKYQSTSNRCRKCGYNVENERWRICPICGESLKKRKGDR